VSLHKTQYPRREGRVYTELACKCPLDAGGRNQNPNPLGWLSVRAFHRLSAPREQDPAFHGQAAFIRLLTRTDHLVFVVPPDVQDCCTHVAFHPHVDPGEPIYPARLQLLHGISGHLVQYDLKQQKFIIRS